MVLKNVLLLFIDIYFNDLLILRNLLIKKGCPAAKTIKSPIIVSGKNKGVI